MLTLVLIVFLISSIVRVMLYSKYPNIASVDEVVDDLYIIKRTRRGRYYRCYLKLISSLKSACVHDT